ncbi:glycosyltransferase family 4 protein [Pedobacter sp. Leaf194]|uniref:glycosyltransferase family 4 protein n=1 Tax=Pedobacter sp. Leaf194 TaxID=1736297 RepID=UPI000702893B|nr:glycosyltransferase family 4 protein [Pedobacter sp. Leaf194]KQS37800.1 glycosyl transferase [Pedobacter sp. Leaf194]
MNILFLTLVEINDIKERGIYHDLLRKFSSKGHDVTIVTPVERRKGIATNLAEKNGVSILHVRTFNIQKTNIIEKGIGTLAIEFQYLSAIKKYASNKKYDLIIYSTPPITFYKVIKYIKEKDNAYAYLLLKDIFPQNAVDMKLIKEGSIIHKIFEKKEKALYQISDTIGCMSQANVDFLLNHNPEISKAKVEVNPNTIEPVAFNYSHQQKMAIREKYLIPTNKKVLVYGGNLGKPQGLDFLLETILMTELNEAFFLIVGSGTEFPRIENWFKEHKPTNSKLLQYLPKEDYDQLLSACDVGLIFLDKNFLIPNFPSRLLSYLEMKKPVLAATDPNTDIGDIIEFANCGYKVSAGNQTEMQSKLKKLVLEDDLHELGKNAGILLLKEYLVDRTFNLIAEKR